MENRYVAKIGIYSESTIHSLYYGLSFIHFSTFRSLFFIKFVSSRYLERGFSPKKRIHIVKNKEVSFIVWLLLRAFRNGMKNSFYKNKGDDSCKNLFWFVFLLYYLQIFILGKTWSAECMVYNASTEAFGVVGYLHSGKEEQPYCFYGYKCRI